MDALTLSAVCILCTSSLGQMPPAIARWQPLIAEAALRFAVPQSWIARVMQAESGGHTDWNGQPITSSAGAMGLMQLMPQTYAALRTRYGLGADPYLPRDNILAGAAYLRAMYERYGYPNLFAAYNAGPHRVDAYLLARHPLPTATMTYMAAIIPGFSGTVASFPAGGPTTIAPHRDRLFIALRTDAATGNPRSELPSADQQTVGPVGAAAHDLFVPLTAAPP